MSWYSSASQPLTRMMRVGGVVCQLSICFCFMSVEMCASEMTYNITSLALSAQLRFRGYQSLPTSNHQLYEGKLPQIDWWQKPGLMRVGHYTMISPAHHNYACHPESFCGVSWNQLTPTVSGENPGSRLRWSMPTSWTTPQSDSRVLLSLDNRRLS